MDEPDPIDVDEQIIGYRITVGARTVELYHKSMGPYEAGLFRAAYSKMFGVQVSLSTLLSTPDAFDTDVVASMWWLGRVLAGEKRLTVEQAFKEFPTMDDMDSLQVDVILEDEPDDAPEA